MHEETKKTETTYHEATRMLRQKRRMVLRVSVPDEADQLVELTRTRVTLGRSRSNHVVLAHGSVSALHAELHQRDERIELVDSGSHNGSWVNERWVSRGEVIVGDEIRLGKTSIVLVSFDEVEVPLASEHQLGELWGASEAMREIFARLKAFADSDINLLITGETGTGKELAARAVHALSPRAHGPFEVVDCGKLVPTLAASALFGHARGAFTGADRATPGSFEVAHGGTIFLDEIGELAHEQQTMLLRVLDRGEVTRIGEHNPRLVDVRVIAATHRNLSAMVAAGTFREDLYFRLVEGDVEMPPLRRRKGDIPFLTQWLLARETHDTLVKVSPGVQRLLERHRWPGNVRELRNVLRRAVALARAAQRNVIVEENIRMLPAHSAAPGELEGLARLGTYSAIQDAVDRVVLARVLDDHGGVVSHAAQTLGISRRRLRDRLIHLGLLGMSADEPDAKE